jgi:hypothetical protein
VKKQNAQEILCHLNAGHTKSISITKTEREKDRDRYNINRKKDTHQEKIDRKG